MSGKPEPMPDPRPALSAAPSEIRSRILAQHDRLRKELAELDKLSAQVANGDAESVPTLRDDVIELLAHLEEHMTYEETVLEPLLLDIDPARPTLANRLREDHLEQRSRLKRFADSTHLDGPQVLADRVRGFIEALHADMRSEEEAMLHPHVLRDDAISIDQEDG